MNNERIIDIQGEDVDFLKAIPGELPYKPMTKDEATGELVPNTESPLYGQKYRRFVFNDKVFTANVADEFCRLYDEEQLWKVRFSVDDAGNYSLVKGVSTKRALSTATTSAAIQKVYREVTLTPANDQLISDLA